MHAQSPDSEALDVIVRFHDLNRAFELKRAIFALVCQNYRPLTITLVTQRFSTVQTEQLRAELAPTLSIDKSVKINFLNYSPPHPTDARSCLLNLGIKNSTGRYLAFLDHDDTIFSAAYQDLIGELKNSNCSIAFGEIAMKDAEVFAGALLVDKRRSFPGSTLIDLFDDNFCPIHSFVIDRQSVNESDLWFDESLSMLEDYDFLLRVCSKYESSFRLIGQVVGDYYIKNDNSNTLPGTLSMNAVAAENFNQRALAIEARKQKYLLSEAVQKRFSVFSMHKPLTIAEVLTLSAMHGLR